MSDTEQQMLWLGLTALAAGVVNSAAGGGTLLTFPALLAALAPLGDEAGRLANATSTVALLPGSLASAWGYRREAHDARRWIGLLLAPSLVGGALGSLLLTRLRAKYFDVLIPWLILTAALLFLAQPAVARLTRHEPTAAGPSRRLRAALVAFQFVVAVYGGYFGAGIGILMLSALALMGLPGVHQMNAVKNFLAFCINGVSVVIFVAEDKVVWRFAPVMVAASVAGGYLGARVARRVPQPLVRGFIVAVGLTLAAFFFYRQFVGKTGADTPPAGQARCVSDPGAGMTGV